MTKILLTFLAVFCLTGSACTRDDQSPAAVTPAAPVPSQTLETHVEEVVVSDIPKSKWEPIFFETIDERTKLAKIGRLRNSFLRNDNIEVRIWGGFGLSPVEGFVLSRKNDQWSAFRLDQDLEGRHWNYRTLELKEPSSGWEQTWNELLRQGLLTLPDAQSINCHVMAADGYSYVVEIKKGVNYRTYMYDNPDGRCKESRDIIAISKTIEERFNISAATR